MDSRVFKFVCQLEGFKTAIKSLHWDSKNLSQHKLCDDIAERIADFQDQVSEVEQAISGNLALNKLKPISYKVKGLKSFVEDVISATNKFYKKVNNMGIKYVGMSSDCESFLSDMQRNLYLVNFTLKEEFKREYRKKINEQKRELTISCGKIREIVNESVKKCVNEYVSAILKEDYYSMQNPYGHRKYSDFSPEESKGLFDYDPGFAISYTVGKNDFEPAPLGNIPNNEPDFPEDEQPYMYWKSLKDFDDRKPIDPSDEDKEYQMDKSWRDDRWLSNWSDFDYADEDGHSDYNFNVHDNAFDASGAKGRVGRLDALDNGGKGDKARKFNGTLNSLRK